MNAGMKTLLSRTVVGAALILGGLFNQAAAETITYIHTDALGVWILYRLRAIRWAHSDATDTPIRIPTATLIPMAGERVAKTQAASWSRGRLAVPLE